jgi:hypothetical protein
MRVYISLDENNRVRGWGSSPISSQSIEVEIDKNHEVLKNPLIFKYENGSFIKDTLYQQQLIEEKERIKNKPTPEQIQKDLSELFFELVMRGVL